MKKSNPTKQEREPVLDGKATVTLTLELRHWLRIQAMLSVVHVRTVETTILDPDLSRVARAVRQTRNRFNRELARGRHAPWMYHPQPEKLGDLGI